MAEDGLLLVSAIPVCDNPSFCQILQAQASAACGIACTTFFALISLFFQGPSAPPAAAISTVLGYIIYRGCVEGLMTEVAGLTDP